MLVIGIDPGTRATGYGLIETGKGREMEFVDGGVVPQKRFAGPIECRLQAVYEGLSRVLTAYAPATAAVEGIFVAGNVRTALRLGEVRGVILLALANVGIEVSEYSPLEIKKAVVGYGKATKEQVQEMVQKQLHIHPAPDGEATPRKTAGQSRRRVRRIPDDLTDALAAAICHAQTVRFSTALRKEIIG